MAIHSSSVAIAEEGLPLEREIYAYESRQAELERDQCGKFVLFHKDDLVGLFEDFTSAVNHAIKLYGRGPYLIRKIGAPTILDPTTSIHISAAR